MNCIERKHTMKFLNIVALLALALQHTLTAQAQSLPVQQSIGTAANTPQSQMASMPAEMDISASQPSSRPASQPASAPVAALTQDAAPAVRLPVGSMMMNFKDAPLEAVLREMSSQLGLVILDPGKVTGRVSVVSRQPLSTDEAVDTLNSVLKTNGYTCVRTGKCLRVVTLEEARSTCIPVQSGSDPSLLGQSDAIITQVIPIRYAEAQKLCTDIAQLIPKYAHITSNVASNTIIYTATEADVRHVVEIVQALDVHLSEADMVRVFQLQYADATTTAKLITDIFNADKATTSGNNASAQRREFFNAMRGGRGGGPGGSGGQAAATPTDSGGANTVRQQKIAASADQQTNSVVVSAPPAVMGIIADVVTKLDSSPTAEESIFVYPLSNAKATELESVLQEIFNDSTTTSSNGRTSNGRTNSRQTSGGGNFRDRASAAGTPTAGDASDLAGKVYVVAEEATNSLLVRTAPKYFDRVKAILEDLDRSTRQVLIKVLIAEVTHDNSLDLGTEFSVLNIGIGSGDAKVATNFGLSPLSSGLVAKYVSEDFNVTLRALQQTGKLDVLSRPYLLGSENQTASITVGENVPYISNSRITDTGQTINTVDYRDIGIILNVTPYIGPDGMVIMDVDQTISSFTGRTVTVSEGFNAEVYANRVAKTRVSVQSGHTVVIGGLMQDRMLQTVDKVPLLGDIPLLGYAFKRVRDVKAKTELLIFLCPQTALTPEQLANVSAGIKIHAKEVKNAIEKGAYDQSMKELEEACPEPAPCDAPIGTALPESSTPAPDASSGLPQ